MKRLFSKISHGWNKFANILGQFSTEIILFLFYFLIFVPFGLILKIFGHDPLKIKPEKNSNWQDVDIGEFDSERASHQS
ncbi:MAG: SxtJ family membrane protein [Candidatus Zixiibacteriota bacterium]